MRFLPLFAFAVSLLLSACAVESEKPLSSPRYADKDPRLEGLWRVKLDEKDTVYLYIAYGPRAHGSIMLFGKDKTGMGTMSWDFFVTRTSKHAYLNMLPLVEVSRGHVRPRPSKMYTFEEYRFSWRGQLIVSSVGGEVFSKAVKEGKLHGKTDLFTTTISHEPSQRVLAFIETSRPQDVFMKSWTATKVGNP
jgi:hypothetical protein